jgi:hypothetical protein
MTCPYYYNKSANHKRKPFVCRKQCTYIPIGNDNTHTPSPMCEEEELYYYSRTATNVYNVLSYLLQKNADSKFEEHEMAALVEYMLTSAVQGVINKHLNPYYDYDEKGYEEMTRKYIQRVFDDYYASPPTNNKFASELKELVSLLDNGPKSIAQIQDKQISDKAHDILYPFTCQAPTDKEYQWYAYDLYNEPCEDSIKEQTCYYHLIAAHNVWYSYLEHLKYRTLPSEIPLA